MSSALRLLTTALLALTTILPALAADPFARVSVDPTGDIVPGQQIGITVDVLAPNFFTSPPQFPLFDLENAIVTLPAQRSQNLVETIDGIQYSGIRKTYAVIPETSATFVLPPAAITFRYADDKGQSVAGTTQIPAVNFTVGGTGGTGTNSLVFAAANVVLSQSFDRDPARLKVGETLLRTVTVFAQGTQSMMIPALSITQPAGLKVYSQPPRLADDVTDENGTTGSTRSETITYLAEEAGTFEIPAVTLQWFDTASRMTEQAGLPASAVTVTPAPAPAQSIAPQLQAPNADDGRLANLAWKTCLTAAFGLLIVITGIYWLARAFFPAVRDRVARRRQERSRSEHAYFERLLSSIESEEPRLVYGALNHWTGRAGFRSIADWCDATADPQLREKVAELEGILFSERKVEPGALDRVGLMKVIICARSRNRRESEEHAPRAALPALNP